VRLAAIIWASLTAKHSPVPLVGAHRPVLDERLAEHDKTPDDVVSRDQLIADARRR
jgi:Putative addiction module component